MAYLPSGLRSLVQERAEGRCEYCRIPELLSFAVFEVDHIIALKPGGMTEENNLALSCSLCNKHKGSDIASIDHETKNIVALYHPRNDEWPDHFRVSGNRIIPLTPVGRVTVQLLQLNALDRMKERELMIAAGFSFDSI